MFTQPEIYHDAEGRRSLSISLSRANGNMEDTQRAADHLGLTSYLNGGVRSLVVRLLIEPSRFPIEVYAAHCLEAGMAFSSALLNSQIRHIYHCDGSGAMIYHLFLEQSITPSELADAAAAISLSLSYSFPHEYRIGELAHRFDEIGEACQRCVQAFDGEASFVPAKRNARIAENFRPKVGDAVRMILRKAGSNELSVSALAAAVDLTPSYLCRIFREDVGKSPSAFLTELRMQRAKELLEDKSLRIHDIALASGYENAEYFSRVFRQHVGLTPTQYRQRNLAEGELYA